MRVFFLAVSCALFCCSYDKPEELQYVYFTDSRDGKTYRTVKIGYQTWMAENLNYSGEPNDTLGVCYKGTNCNDKYGRHYNWETAMKACPDGWHLPSEEEWFELANAVGETNAGAKLKATSGWSCTGESVYINLDISQEWLDLIVYSFYPVGCERSGDGSDEFGFSALPGGAAIPDGSFDFSRNIGYWWSSTSSDNRAEFLALHNHSNEISNRYANKLNSLSVRCVKD